MSCNLCSMCGGPSAALNYAKLVDPYPPGYGTILGDEPPRIKRVMGGCMGPIQVCLPTFACPHPINYGRHNPGQQPCIVNVPRDCAKECPKIICEPCPPPPPTKVWLIKSSPMPQKSFAIAQPPPCIPICNQPIFIPCQRPC